MNLRNKLEDFVENINSLLFNFKNRFRFIFNLTAVSLRLKITLNPRLKLYILKYLPLMNKAS